MKTALQQFIEWGTQMIGDHPAKTLSFYEAIDKAEELLEVERQQFDAFKAQMSMMKNFLKQEDKMKEPSNLLASVIMDLKVREERGLATYGTTMDRKDLSRKEWLQHAYEEALDLALYLKKLIEEENIVKLKYHLKKD